MNIEPTQDVFLIKSVMLELWDEIASDKEASYKDKLDEIIPYSFDKHIFFKIEKDNNLVGFNMYEYLEDGAYTPHITILHKYRGRVAIRATQQTNILIQEIGKCYKLQTTIPTCHTDAQKFATFFKFKYIKTINNMWLKNGIYYDGILSELELSTMNKGIL